MVPAVLALAPWVTVVGYETVGHRHNAEVLAALRASRVAGFVLLQKISLMYHVAMSWPSFHGAPGEISPAGVVE